MMTKRQLIEALAGVSDNAFVYLESASGGLVRIDTCSVCDVGAEGDIPFAVIHPEQPMHAPGV